MRPLLTAAAAAAVVVAVMPAVSGQSARGAKPSPMLSGGNGTMYIGTYKGEIEIYDEATEKLTDKITLKTGVPRSVTPSPDRTRFYVLELALREIEVVDIATRKTIDSFKLTVGNKHLRVNNLQPDPNNKFLILMYRTATKLVDRWEIGPPTHPAVRPDHSPVHPHDPVAEGRRAREREHAPRPRRQAPVHLRRRSDGARDRPTSPRWSRGRTRRRPSPGSAGSISDRRTTSTIRPGPSPACSRWPTRCRSAG